ncbi:hypothetical protein ACFFRR_000980 [Megaselia abdita]
MESTLTSTPIGGGTSTIKKFYSVKTSQNSTGLHDDWANEKESNVSKLDTLLQDLKNEREFTRQNDLFKNSNVEEYNSLVRDTKKYYPTSQTGGKYIYSKEEILSDNIPNEERYNTYNSSSYREETNKRDTLKDAHLNSALSKSYSLNRHNVIQSDDIVQSADFNKLQLSDDILPIPGTKVTTTVRTYTYEVPTDGIVNRDVIIKDVSHSNTLNTSSSVISGHTPITEPDPNSKIYSYEEHINRSSNNYTPIPNTQKTIKYSATSQKYVDENISLTPPRDNVYLQSSNVSNKQHQMIQRLPSPPGISNTYYYNSNESNNHINYPQTTTIRPIVDHTTPKSIEYRIESTSQVHNVHENPPHIQNSPNNSVVTYKYSTHTTTNNQGQPVRLVQPFPIYDESDGPDKYSQPPKHLNELLTNLNGTNTNGQTVIEGYNPKLEVETAVAKENGNKVVVPSKNVAGPPVYYPPNHELTLRREEKGAAYRAGGGWARARGEYEYEAESKSKTKSKSGGAVVPVCLPLCCAMPCSIM